MTLLLTVLGAMLCSLMVSAQVQPQADFDLQRMVGKWYLLGYATNAEWFLNARNNMTMTTSVAYPTANGDLVVKRSTLNPDGSCSRGTKYFLQTDVLGKFMYLSSFGNKILIMSHVKYDEYAVSFTIKFGDPTVNIKLYGRGVDLSADLWLKFFRFSVKNGILPENIVFFPNKGSCPAI